MNPTNLTPEQFAEQERQRRLLAFATMAKGDAEVHQTDACVAAGCYIPNCNDPHQPPQPKPVAQENKC